MIEQQEDKTGQHVEMEDITVRECPFPDCDWVCERTKIKGAGVTEEDEIWAEQRSEWHYENEHAGEIKLHAKFTKTVTVPHNDAQKLSDELHDSLLDEMPEGMELTFTAAEIVEEADNHEVLDDAQ